MSAPALWRGEAPGRFDVLGGVAHSSGALVLQMPTRATTRVEIEPRVGSGAFAFGSERERTTFHIQGAALHAVFRRPIAEWRDGLDGIGAPLWTRFLMGCLGVFTRETTWWPDTELRFRVSSDVPRSQGVASSAALEVATLRALSRASGLQLNGKSLARLAWTAENEVVGTPCDISDQLTSVYGERDALLPILCRPDILSEPILLPDGVYVVGWPSGVFPSVTNSLAAIDPVALADSPGQTARTAAFMGRQMLESRLGPREYLCEFAPSEISPEPPVLLSGQEFTSSLGALNDSSCRMEDKRLYPVRASARFAVEEHFRCQLAQFLLRGGNAREALPLVGELLFQSHAGYSLMGLGTPSTDAMVEAIRALGLGRGFYGARTSGSGAGGTVVVLLEGSAVPELESLREEFPASGALMR